MKELRLSEAEAREFVEDVCELYRTEVLAAPHPRSPWMFACDYCAHAFSVFKTTETKEVDDEKE